jgi:hypothetical protein
MRAMDRARLEQCNLDINPLPIRNWKETGGMKRRRREIVRRKLPHH